MAAGLLIGLGKEKGAADKSSGKSAAPDPETMAAEDLIDAVKSGDAAGVAAAYRSMYDACAVKKSATSAPYPTDDEEMMLPE